MSHGSLCGGCGAADGESYGLVAEVGDEVQAPRLRRGAVQYRRGQRGVAQTGLAQIAGLRG